MGGNPRLTFLKSEDHLDLSGSLLASWEKGQYSLHAAGFELQFSASDSDALNGPDPKRLPDIKSFHKGSFPLVFREWGWVYPQKRYVLL